MLSDKQSEFKIDIQNDYFMEFVDNNKNIDACRPRLLNECKKV